MAAGAPSAVCRVVRRSSPRLRAVMDAAGSQRAALIGSSEGVPMSILFAATYPDRVQALVCEGGMARSTWAEDYPWQPRDWEPQVALYSWGPEVPEDFVHNKEEP